MGAIACAIDVSVSPAAASSGAASRPPAKQAKKSDRRQIDALAMVFDPAQTGIGFSGYSGGEFGLRFDSAQVACCRPGLLVEQKPCGAIPARAKTIEQTAAKQAEARETSDMAPVQRLKDYDGPAILSYGFRPFFLSGALFAGIAILAWLPMFDGRLALPTAFAPRDWHVHEMLFGYLAAVMTGFLLTAIPNWTGRLPIQGRPLLALVMLWLAGRLVISFSAWSGWVLAAAIDISFLLVVMAVAAREIVAGANRHNLRLLVILALFTAGNVIFHVEANIAGAADYGTRIGIAAAIALITIVGGRVVPSFTRNWLARLNPGRLPAPFGRFDAVSIVATAAALLLWTAAPYAAITGVALVAAGLLQAARLARWAGDRTFGDRLVLILHLGYAFVPLGLVLAGASALSPEFPASAGIHAWTGGAVGTMTIAVMSRASLGHTGRPLVASPATQLIYGMIVGGTLIRIWAALQPELTVVLITLAGLTWAGGFLVFALHYWTTLTGPRLRPAAD